MAFQRRTKVSSSNLCTARSRCTVILTVRCCHLTWVTAPEATLTKRVAWMRLEFEPRPFHRSLGSYSSVHQRRESYLQILLWHRACGPHVMTRSRQLYHELVHLREVLWTASDRARISIYAGPKFAFAISPTFVRGLNNEIIMRGCVSFRLFRWNPVIVVAMEERLDDRPVLT
jgi:hypothetical protein